MWLKGIPVTLYERTKTGVDALGIETFDVEPVTIENVLVYPATETEVLETTNLTGKEAIYTMCLPKGDTHNWENTEVEFFGKRWRTIGFPLEYIEELVPLEWNKKVRVESIA